MWSFFRKHSTNTVLVALVLFSFSCLWFGGKTAIASPRDIGMSIVSFFQNLSHSLSSFVGDTANSVQQLSALRNDYNKLEAKLQGYEEKQSDIEQLHAENDRLREVLQFSTSMGMSNIPAQIIAKDPGILFNTLTLNKGFNSGVKKGMSVIAIQNGRQGLVGKVQSVGASTCQVLPIFDAQNYIAARLDRNRYEGLVNGGGTSIDNLLMTYVDPEAKNAISVNDEVVSSGLNSLYPPNLLIGKVAAIESKPYESSLTLKIHPFIEFSRLEYVFLVDYVPEVSR